MSLGTLRIAGLALAALPWLAARAHHPGDPTEGLHWWEFVIAGGIALAVLWIVAWIRRRGTRQRPASIERGTPSDDVT